MTIRTKIRAAVVFGLIFAVSGCGTSGGSWLPFSKGKKATADTAQRIIPAEEEAGSSSVWDVFGKKADPNVTVKVNKYLWQASLDVLNFLPIQSVDPFSGLIVTGYGTPPGGGQAYRATIYVSDPALDARSLKVSLETRSGTVSSDTISAVEDAILTRARQLRVRDSKL